MSDGYETHDPAVSFAQPTVGLRPKYDVRKASTGELVYPCFVLRPDRDPASVAALAAYAEATDNAELAADLRRWLEELLALATNQTHDREG